MNAPRRLKPLGLWPLYRSAEGAAPPKGEDFLAASQFGTVTMGYAAPQLWRGHRTALAPDCGGCSADSRSACPSKHPHPTVLPQLCYLSCVTSAAKAGLEGKPIIAAVNRCATPNPSGPLLGGANIRTLLCYLSWVTSAAKAGLEGKPIIAAVNRCATQTPAGRFWVAQTSAPTVLPGLCYLSCVTSAAKAGLEGKRLSQR